MPFGERMSRASPTCTWHIARTSFICFSSGEIEDFLAPQSVSHGDYSSRLWTSHCGRLCGQCLALECGLVPSFSLLEIPSEESNAHRNLVISSSPSPRRDATAQKWGCSQITFIECGCSYPSMLWGLKKLGEAGSNIGILSNLGLTL